MSRRSLLRLGGLSTTIAVALLQTGCTTPRTVISRSSPSASASETATASPARKKTPFQEYYEIVPPELKARIEALEAKTSAERQQLPWGDQTLYALAWAIEREYNGEFNDDFIDTKTGIGFDGDSLQNHTPIRTTLNVTSSGQDIWEQSHYFQALIPSMLTFDTQRDFVPLAAAENSFYYEYYVKFIPSNDPGNWNTSQEEPAWKATRGDVYPAKANGKQVARCNLNVGNPTNPGGFVTVFEFTEMPLLQAVVAYSGKSASTEQPGIWVPVEERK